MDASLLTFRGGVRSLGKKPLSDGNEHELFYKAMTPQEVATLSGALANADKLEDGEARSRRLQTLNTKLILKHMCTEDGDPLFESEQQAALVPETLKVELRNLIFTGSNSLTDSGKA
jgi:hypothetical protein